MMDLNKDMFVIKGKNYLTSFAVVLAGCVEKIP